jgi:hypothetical protein
MEPHCHGETETEKNVTLTRRNMFWKFDLCVSRKHMLCLFWFTPILPVPIHAGEVRLCC